MPQVTVYFVASCLIFTWSLLQCAQMSRLQEVSLEAGNSFPSWWKLAHFDPRERLEHEGRPVLVSFDYANTVFVEIKHNVFSNGFVFKKLHWVEVSCEMICSLTFVFRPMRKCWLYTVRRTRLSLLWVTKSFGIVSFPLETASNLRAWHPHIDVLFIWLKKTHTFFV